MISLKKLKILVCIFSIILLFSCSSQNSEQPLQLIPVESDLLLELPEYLFFEEIWEIKISGIYNIMADDFIGDNEIEIICSSQNKSTVLDINGKIISSFILSEGSTPATIRDFDEDGKMDILYHTPTGPEAELIVLNGLGTELASLSPQINDSSFERLTIECIDNDSIYLRLNSDDMRSLQGFMKVSLQTLDKTWFCPTPFIPEQLFPDKDLKNGNIYNFYPGLTVDLNKETKNNSEIESNLIYSSISPNGRYREIRKYENEKHALKSKVRYLQMNPEGFILLYENIYSNAKIFRFLSIDHEGNIIDESDDYAGTPLSWVESGSNEIILAAKSNDETLIYYKITNLSDLKIIELSNSINLLSPYIATTNITADLSTMHTFLFLADKNAQSGPRQYLLAADDSSVRLFRFYKDVNKTEGIIAKDKEDSSPRLEENQIRSIKETVPVEEVQNAAVITEFNEIIEQPLLKYSNDFEDNSHSHITTTEWQIIDDGGNKVFAPVIDLTNSDAVIDIYAGKNFTIEFDIKRMKSSGNDPKCWFALDFYMSGPGRQDKSLWLNSQYTDTFYFGERGNTNESIYNTAMKWETWHSLKATVREGKYFMFYLDGKLFGKREIEETLITKFKIEGNPEIGNWYMDNLNITWNEEPAVELQNPFQHKISVLTINNNGRLYDGYNLTYFNDSLYTVDWKDNMLKRFSLLTDNVILSDSKILTDAVGIHGIAYDSDTNNLWACDLDDSKIIKYNPDLTVNTIIPLGIEPNSITIYGNKVFIVDRYLDKIYVIDKITHKIINGFLISDATNLNATDYMDIFIFDKTIYVVSKTDINGLIKMNLNGTKQEIINIQNLSFRGIYVTSEFIYLNTGSEIIILDKSYNINTRYKLGTNKSSYTDIEIIRNKLYTVSFSQVGPLTE